LPNAHQLPLYLLPTTACLLQQNSRRHRVAARRTKTFALFRGKSKALEEVEEVDVPVSQVRSYRSRASADGYLRPAHWTSTSSTRPALARVNCNMTSSMSDAFSESMPALTALQHRGSTWTRRRRSENLDGRKREDVASRLSARRLEEWRLPMFCQSHDFWLRRECLQQGGLAAVFYFRRRSFVGSTRLQARVVGQPPTYHLHWTQSWGNRDQKGKAFTSGYRLLIS
jgi:hypothetical protein